jgi:peptide/nickel transport system substrate-binding protein
VHFIQFDSIGRAGESPCQKLEVRRAIYHAIDREAIIKNVKQGYGVMLNGPLYPTYFAQDPSVKAIEPQYDPEQAKRLLAKAGYPDGFEAELSAYEQKEVYEAVLGYLRKVGIKTTLNWYGADIGTLIKLRNAGKVKDMGAYSWGANIFDPDYFLPYWYTLNVEKNYMNDADIDRWLAEAGAIFDQTKRAELYSQVQHRIVEKAYWVPVFGEVAVFGVNKNLNFSSIGEYPKYFKCSWK